jgi:hypothetical protein
MELLKLFRFVDHARAPRSDGNGFSNKTRSADGYEAVLPLQSKKLIGKEPNGSIIELQ